jgi:hypothetical protein
MANDNDDALVVVFSGNSVEAEMIKDMLETNGVQAALKDEFMGSIAPYIAPGGIGAVKVVVRQGNLDEAKLIMKELSGETSPD